MAAVAADAGRQIDPKLRVAPPCEGRLFLVGCGPQIDGDRAGASEPAHWILWEMLFEVFGVRIDAAGSKNGLE